jgi:hypothetical protein
MASTSGLFLPSRNIDISFDSVVMSLLVERLKGMGKAAQDC